MAHTRTARIVLTLAFPLTLKLTEPERVRPFGVMVNCRWRRPLTLVPGGSAWATQLFTDGAQEVLSLLFMRLLERGPFLLTLVTVMRVLGRLQRDDGRRVRLVRVVVFR